MSVSNVESNERKKQLMLRMEEVEKACSYDNYLDADEAVEFGLVDAVVNAIF